jgi:hypothetical protein
VAALEELTPFHAALAANRERYNARFRLVKHRAKQLDANAFLAHLRDSVGPAVDAAAAAGADPVEVTDALVDLAFATHGRPPARLKQLLPELGQFLAAAPRRIPVAMANALHHLESSGDPEGWVATMTAVAPLVSTTDGLLDAGAVAAWRHGLAVLRPSALATARQVPAEVLARILGTSDVDALAGDPWCTPGRADAPRLRMVGRVGRFRGFGGTFARPPRVFISAGQWHATDGHETWRVHADRFGTGLRRVTHTQPDEPAPSLTLSRSGRAQFGKKSLDVPELAGATSWVSTGNTLAATTKYTHAITFVAWTP